MPIILYFFTHLLYNGYGDNMIQYPSGKRPVQNKQSIPTKSNLGSVLEDDINRANEYYRIHKIAVVHKKPTPVQVVSVDYPSRSKVKITEAYYRKASTTDFNGVYDGYPIDFEAKETKNKTSFPLSLIQAHQLNHLESVLEQKAIAFFIIRFTSLDHTYLVYAKDILNFVETQTRKSIPLKWFEQHAHRIKQSYQCPCDYISVIQAHINKESI